MRRFALLLVLLCQSACPLVRAQAAPQQEKPAPLTLEQQELSRLVKEGNAALDKADFTAAEKAFRAGLEKAQTRKDEIWTAKFLNNLGNVCLSLGQFEKALDFYNRTLTIDEKLGNKREIAESLDNVGIAYDQLGQLEKAQDFGSRALAFFEKLGNPQDTASSLNIMGSICYEQGQYEKARDFFTRALALFEKLGNPRDITSGLIGLGNIYEDLGQYEQARDFFTRALALFEKLGNPQDIAGCLHNLGNVSYDLGQFETSLDFNNRALALVEKLGNDQDIASALTGIGNVYNSLGQFEKALDFLNRALALREKQGNNQEIATSLDNLGNIYESLNQYKKALDSYTRGRALREKLGNEKDRAASLHNLGCFYYFQGQSKKALDFHNRALALRKKLGNKQLIAASLDNLGVIYYSLNQYEKAVDFHNRALSLREKLGNDQDIAASFLNLGLAYSHRRRFDQAERSFVQAISWFEHFRAQISDPSQLGSLQNADQGNPYLAYALFLIERKRPAQALQYAERGHGQGLALQARQNHANITALLSTADAAQRQQKQIELAAASALWQAAQNRLVPSDKTEQQALLDQQKQAEQRYRKAETDWTALEASLRLKYPRYRQLQGFASPSAAELAALAHNHPDTLFVESAIVDDTSSLLIVLSTHGVKAFSLPVGNKVLRNRTEDWKRALIHRSAEEPALARKLGKIILAPLEKTGLLQSEGFSHLVIVADGPLLDIPFAALMDSKGKRLIERFAVSSAFSLGSLLWPQEQRQPTGTLLCAADPSGDGSQTVSLASRGGGFRPLPAARREVQQLLPLFAGSKTVAYFGKEAQRERIQQQMSQYALLHFATHGIADGTIGLRSGLLLADDKTEENYSILEARDIVSMKLSAQMAVLSACETAEGQKSGGDGLLGLAWAFRAAGCPSIVASQWEVNDEATGQLMLAFYKALKAGKRKDEALRQAMLSVRKQKPAPFYWAAFQVMGDTQPLHRP